MAGSLVSSQNLISQKLNDVNDSVAGNQTAGGTGNPLYALLGVRILLDNVSALALSDTTVGTLYGGIYQYVNVLSGSTQAPTRGYVVFWGTTQTGANPFASDGISPYAVATDGSATVGDGLWAGITLNAVTKGNYGWIQIAGLASAAFKANPTSNLIGNLVVVVTTTFTVDAIADATAVNNGVLKRQIGVCAEAPGTSSSIAVARIFMKNNLWMF